MIDHVLLKQPNEEGQYVVEKWEDGRFLGVVTFATRAEAIAITTEACSANERNLKYE